MEQGPFETERPQVTRNSMPFRELKSFHHLTLVAIELRC
jgi:hypothetical protein